MSDWPSCRYGTTPTKAWITVAGANKGGLCVHLRNGRPPSWNPYLSFAERKRHSLHGQLCREQVVRLCQRPGARRGLVIQKPETCADCKEREDGRGE